MQLSTIVNNGLVLSDQNGTDINHQQSLVRRRSGEGVRYFEMLLGSFAEPLPYNTNNPFQLETHRSLHSVCLRAYVRSTTYARLTKQGAV